MLAATIAPARLIRGRLRVPGDKSISHRYALVAALAHGRSRLTGFSTGADCHSTLSCLRRLGVEIAVDPEGTLSLLGRGLGGFRVPDEPLDAGNSGTTMRMLTGVLSGQAFTSTIVGDASLSRRPMGRVMEPLGRMGARIDATDGRAPLTIHGTPLHAIAYQPEVPSAQVKSAVLLAGLHASGETSVSEPAETRDHTERALTAFGAVVNRRGLTISVDGGQRLIAGDFAIPGDISSAAFWMVAAAALPGSRIEIEGVGLNPTRTALIGVLRRFGAKVFVEVVGTDAGEPHGTIVVEGDRAGTITIAAEEVPGLIDELPAIAALASHSGEVTVRGAAELRVKESDRIAALVAGLRNLGVSADEWPDGFTVHGTGAPSGGVADAHDDHRIAMAMAIAALAARGPSTINGAESVAISYPGFFETLGRLVA
ncbi:MAG: 3-phosphoshikimate 1-carboxyvinyltransferase [Acidobacteriota bacterium]